MKFSQQLEEYKFDLWKDHYIPYVALKKKLEDIKQQLEFRSPSASLTPASSTSPSIGGLPSSPPSSPNCSFKSPNGSTPGSIKGAWRRKRAGSSPDALTEGSSEEMWCLLLTQHAKHAGEFVEKGVIGLRTQLEALSKMGEKFAVECCMKDDNHHEELRFLEALGRVKEGLAQLKAFAEINHAAMYKILKKHDKMLSMDNGIKTLFPRLVAQSKLGDMAPLDELDNEVQKLSLLTSQCEGLDASLEVANLAAGLGRNTQAGTISSPSQVRSDNMLFFFLGSTAALLLSIAVFIMLPPDHPESFILEYFLSPFPVFEAVLAVVLTLWGLGFVMRVCDDKNINYKFLLSIDPRARVQPSFFFSRAAVLTSCWILAFGMYVVDYKWMIFPTIDADKGYNHRSSLHFVIYPAVLVVVAVFVVFAPSKKCICRYWYEFIKSLGRTAAAPLYPVSFFDNLVGDVLTSLSKPLQVMPSAMCYFLSPHPQTKRSVARFVEHGNLCPSWEHKLVNPFIAACPFIFRALQCFRRWWDTGQTKHLCNFGKYIASLVVVFVSAFWGSGGMTIACVSGFATIYAATWDIGLDWGLGFHDLVACGRERTTSSTIVQRTSFHDEDAPKGRHFLPRSYWLAAVFDILARLTWIQTLMPSSVLTSDVIAREALIVSTLAVEILRRSIWAILRIEYEQVSNASGFRTLLWVPSKLNAAATLPNLELLSPIDRECHTVFEGSSSASLGATSGDGRGDAREIRVHAPANPVEARSSKEPLLGEP